MELDKKHAGAQKKLGRVLHEGVWMTHDELKRAQGLVLHRGEWISAEEQARREAADSALATRESWIRQLNLIRHRLKVGPAEDRQVAEAQFFEIDDPGAVPAMLDVFAREEPALRGMLIRRLTDAPWPEAVEALARLALVEEEPALWNQVIAGLEARPDPETSKFFISSLGSRDAAQVGRAARALARLQTRSAVPELINALVRVEERLVAVPTPGQAVGPGAPAPNPGYTGLIGRDYVANVEPVVGPGVVAFRPIVGTVGSGVATGGGGYAQPTAPPISIPRPVRIHYPNKEVLAVLEEMTGRNFGYDQAAWRRWQRTSYRVEQQPARRVLEP